jgi:hypothetical protein
MADEENLSCVAVFLKCSDDEMLPEVRNVDTIDCVDTLDPARGLRQQIDYGAAAFHITRRRFDFNECLYERLDFSLPALQGSENLTRD